MHRAVTQADETLKVLKGVLEVVVMLEGLMKTGAE